MLKFTAKQIGEFREVSFGKWFTFSKTENEWALKNDLEFEIDVLDGVRYAKLLKTVVYVCVDEDSEGNPVLEKWSIANKLMYSWKG